MGREDEAGLPLRDFDKSERMRLKMQKTMGEDLNDSSEEEDNKVQGANPALLGTGKKKKKGAADMDIVLLPAGMSEESQGVAISVVTGQVI
jgi:hypothetical protein